MVEVFEMNAIVSETMCIMEKITALFMSIGNFFTYYLHNCC